MAIDLYSYSACLGTLTINWVNRTFTLAGMCGDGVDDEMTVEQVQAAMAEHAGNPDIEVTALIFWPENEQLCAHDAETFAAELAYDKAVANDDGG